MGVLRANSSCRSGVNDSIWRRAVGHSTCDKGRRAAASFSCLPWGLRYPPVAFVCPSSPWPLVERCPKVPAWTKRPAEYGNNPKMLVSGTHPQWHKPASRQAVGDVMRGLADHHSWRCTNVMVTTRRHQCPLSRERCCKYFPTSVEAKPSPTFNTKLQPPNHSWRQFWTFAPSIVYAIHSPLFAVIADLNFEDRSGRRLPTP